MTIDTRGLKFPKPTPAALQAPLDERIAKLAALKFRAAVRLRDGYQCRRCGERVSAQSLDPLHQAQVHHLVKRSRSKALQLVRSNSITVCASCHALIELGRVRVLGRDGDDRTGITFQDRTR